MKKVLLTLLILLLSFAVISCSNTDSQTNGGAVAPSLKNDFYEAVNFNEINSWQIPEDSDSMSYTQMIIDNNTKLLQELVESTYTSQPQKTQKDEYNIAAIYETINDSASRNSNKYGLLDDYITRIDNAQNINELLNTALECNTIYGCLSMFMFEISADIKNSTKYTYYMGLGYGISREQWFSKNTLYADAFINYLTQILTLNGSSASEVNTIVNDAVTVMKDIANASLSISDSSNPNMIYNPKTLTELAAMFNNVITVDNLKSLLGVTDENTQIVVIDINAMNKAVTYLKEENLDLLKNYFKLYLYLSVAKNTTEAQENAYVEYTNIIQGIQEYSIEKYRNKTVQDIVKYELGKQYINKYFSDEIKQDILKMIDNIKATYEKRINNLTWLRAETKVKAVNKLKAMKAYVGVDDTELWPQDVYNYSLQNVSEGGLFVNNILQINKAKNNYYRNELINGNNVANIMLDAPQVVNAYYSNIKNAFKILPGILHAPIYSFNSTQEEKYGAVGVIIAHEISHAFDSNGALFDEFGNYGVDWWLPEDKTRYEALKQKTIEYYNGYELNGIPVNGTLTLSENIADLGAVACITDYAVTNNLNLQSLYTAYGKLWATKIRPEALETQILIDVHSPAKIRTNAVLSATDDFYTAFDIKETDGMYKPKEERPSIW